MGRTKLIVLELPEERPSMLPSAHVARTTVEVDGEGDQGLPAQCCYGRNRPDQLRLQEMLPAAWLGRRLGSARVLTGPDPADRARTTCPSIDALAGFGAARDEG